MPEFFSLIESPDLVNREVYDTDFVRHPIPEDQWGVNTDFTALVWAFAEDGRALPGPRPLPAARKR